MLLQYDDVLCMLCGAMLGYAVLRGVMLHYDMIRFADCYAMRSHAMPQKSSPPILALVPLSVRVDDATWTRACAQRPRNLKRMFRILGGCLRRKIVSATDGVAII